MICRMARSTGTARKGFRDIADNLQLSIDSGEIPVGQYLPTERELQDTFGASRSTVRKALAHLVECGYGQSIPNRGVIVARGSRPVKTKNIALIDGGSYVMRVLTVRLGKMLSDRGYDPVHMGGSPEYPMEYALQRAVDNDFAGAIVWSYKGFPDVEFLTRANPRMPLVALDHRAGGGETDLVTFDHEAAAMAATDQLIRQGCRRIGVTGMLDMLEVSHLRFRGYLRAMFAHGLQPEPRDFVFTVTSGIYDADPYPLETRLRAADRPDGLIVLQDEFVPATIEAALRCGLRLPHDLKIVTVGDDIEVDVDGAGMTAVTFDWESMAFEALRLLTERIENPDLPFRTVIIPHRLTVRGLCGAQPAERTPESDRLRSFAGEPVFARSRYKYSSRWSVQDDGPNSHS